MLDFLPKSTRYRQLDRLPSLDLHSGSGFLVEDHPGIEFPTEFEVDQSRTKSHFPEET